MTKIWECDFTGITGSYPIPAYDNVGNQDLTQGWFQNGAAAKISPLPGFNFRPGVKVDNDNQAQYYNYSDSHTFNAYFSDPYSGTGTRSFVMWVYFVNQGTDTFSFIWGEGRFWEWPNDGIGRNNRLISLRGASNHHVTYTIPTSGFPGWHSIIATVDRNTPVAELWVDGVSRGTTTGGFSTTSGGSQWRGLIGNWDSSHEGDMQIGYCATYDHILTSGEISAIHSSFLVDAVSAHAPGQVSGVVFDESNQPISGADVFLLHNGNPYEIVDHAYTTSSGYYELGVPWYGDFTLVSSNPPDTQGARAVSFTLSGVSGSGTIIWHDGS